LAPFPFPFPFSFRAAGAASGFDKVLADFRCAKYQSSAVFQRAKYMSKTASATGTLELINLLSFLHKPHTNWPCDRICSPRSVLKVASSNDTAQLVASPACFNMSFSWASASCFFVRGWTSSAFPSSLSPPPPLRLLSDLLSRADLVSIRHAIEERRMRIVRQARHRHCLIRSENTVLAQ